MQTIADQDTPPVQANPKAHPRNSRAVLPLWRIKGSFTLATPLHIGNGQDEPINMDGQESFVAQIARDHVGKPYLPGSGIKGALRALALHAGITPAIPPETCQRLFGSMDSRDSTTPARVEFCNAYLAKPTQTSGLPGFDASQQRALLPHSVRNRDYGTVQDKLMFTEQVVPPSSQFEFECTAQNLTLEDIQTLLGILALAGDDNSSFQLGGRKASDNGRVRWDTREVRRMEDFTALWKAVQANPPAPIDLWSSGVVQKKLPAKPLTLSSDQLLLLKPLTLKFHTPFLVYQKIDKKADPDRENGPDAEPRTNHANQALLPASSLHGAMRNQAERILRTLGEETPEGYKVPAVFGLDKAATLNLAAVLFGAPGWRGVLQCTDFVAPPNSPTIDHHMVAIDRLTGGGKDSAKFSIQALDCPTLTGSIRIDLGRLRKLAAHNPTIEARCLGLLAHVLRDLDEGDIALGYGKAKGYGVSQSKTVEALKNALDDVNSSAKLDTSLQAFANAMPQHKNVSGIGLENKASRIVTNPLQSSTPHNDAFHNPYVFLPLPKLTPKDERLPWAGYMGIPESVHSHATYNPAALHGRILCKLTTQTPIFIGAGEPENSPLPKLKQNFRLNENIALPATSLRGMLSSLHESISRSALRVMDDRTYSVRQDTGQDGVNAFSSSAVGRIHINANGKTSVEPLTIPTLSLNDRYSIPDSFEKCFPEGDDGSRMVFSKVLLEPQLMRPKAGSDYLASKSKLFDDDLGRGYWYLPLMPIKVNNNWSCDTYPHFRDKNGFAIGQRPLRTDAYPISQREFDSDRLPAADRAALVRGLLRPMGHNLRQMPPPRVRKYELFVPYPKELDDFEAFSLECTGTCIDRFNALSSERYEQQEKQLPANLFLRLPYTPTNQVRGDGILMPRQGDLVFFKPTTDGNAIAEIAYSSIWRARVETTTVQDNMEQIVSYSTAMALGNNAHAPLTPKGKPRLLSPSEMLFGFVQDMGPDYQKKSAAEKNENPARAFSSKVRFGYGIAKSRVEPEPEVTLKILASPKPPSPTMYFKAKEGGTRYIAKSELVSNAAQYALQGRKTYLHGLRDKKGETQKLTPEGNSATGEQGQLPWVSNKPAEDTQQKVRITPIAKGQDFYFEVDFVNLSQAELESLCATLQPDSSFEHKLGMGKPIGLGSVKVGMMGLFLVNRQTRYRQVSFGGESADCPRYDTVWKHPSFPSVLPEHFAKELRVDASTDIPATPTQLAQSQMSSLGEAARDVFNAIVISGNPDAVKKPVHYPQLKDKPIESKIFEWFVNNSAPTSTWDGRPQQLAGFDAASTSLPTLSRVERKKKEKKHW